MSYSQKYCVVYFKSPQKDGGEFRMDGWPIHITLADVFAVDLDKSSIVKKFEDLCSESIPVPVTVKSESNLGEAPVLLLSESPGLAGLHTKVVSLLESSGAIFNSPEFTRAGFIGHSTVSNEHHLVIGESIAITSLSLVDMFPKGDWQQRKVLATFQLKK